tara:strand:- start:11027 stop:11263 length:237 start_codon:yes stop_codon:yes gene_type:complete
MNLFKYIDVKVFLISLALGLFAVYILQPENKKILVYPTHENVDSLQYKDKAGNCFSIKETNVVCPNNENEISEIEPQS